MARIDRLAAEDKRVLQAAAVIGRSVPFLLLQAILDPADEFLRERLARLQGAEFLYETRAASELEYTFKHALTHEVAYASLLPAQRRALHARIVGALESWQREGREELVERLAHHAIQAEAWEKAVDYARRAGFQAMTRSAHRDAAAWFDQAVAALGHLPERREILEQVIDIQFDLRNALWPLAEFRRVFDCLKRAEHLATTLGDQRRLARRSPSSRPCSRRGRIGPRASTTGAGRSTSGRPSETARCRSWRVSTWPWRMSRWATIPGRRSSHARTSPCSSGACASIASAPTACTPSPPFFPGRSCSGASPSSASSARRSPCSTRACASSRRSAIRTPRRSWPWGRGSSASARATCRGRWPRSSEAWRSAGNGSSRRCST